MQGRILKRELLASHLLQIYNYPMTLIVAAMGYGKTIAVSEFLKEMKADYAWLSVESDDTSSNIFWDGLAGVIAQNDPIIGNTLAGMGLPMSAAEKNRFFDLLEEWAYQKEKFLVIDDYHFIDSPELDLLWEKLVRKRIKGLHVLIISRRRPAMDIQELQLKGYCYWLKGSLFELSQTEITEYFRLYNQDVSATIVKQIHMLTEGWITAVYLICQRYRDIGRLELGIDLQELINTTVLGRYTEVEIKLLISLSILDSFTLAQAAYITNNRQAPSIIRKLSSDNSFIRFDDKSQKYYMHNIFAGHLKGLLDEKAGRQEIDYLYRQAGNWHLNHGHILTGIKFLLKAKEYDLIMQEFEKTSITSILDTATKDIVDIMGKIPLEVRYRYPFGYLAYVDLHLTKVDMDEGARILAEIELFYKEDTSTTPDTKNRIAGEIALIKSFLYFNDISKMHEHHQKAYKLLAGSSGIANKDMIFTFGSPSVIYLFHREEGCMLQVAELMDKAIHCYEKLSHGCGKGCDSLIRAEYHLEKGELQLVERYAHKAIYKAQTTNQISIIICAKFCLARLRAAEGNFQEAHNQLEELAYMVAETNNPVFQNSLDLCYGYLGGITNDPGSFAEWLQTGETKQEEMFYHGLAYNYLIQAKYVLLMKDYNKLEVLCEEMFELFSVFNNLLGYLHSHILNSIAKNRQNDRAEAIKSMQKALEIARKDNIILPFAEYGHYIESLLIELALEEDQDIYLKQVIAGASRYRQNLELVDKQKTWKNGNLTEREMDILRLLSKGQHSKEIGEQLFIAEITVKKAVSSIYRKLGVSSRAAAVRKSMEMRLIE